MRIWWLLVVLFGLTACGKPPLYQEEAYVFGTRVEVTVYGEDEVRARAATTAVMQEFQRLHELLHAWKPSELSRLNEAIATGKTVEASTEVVAILREATALSEQSDGLFNPAIGGLIEAWGFQADEFKAALPDAAKIAALVRANPRMTDIDLSQPKSIKGNKNNKLKIDLGGYAKGYALDRARQILQQQGVRNALVNIGGNILAMGTHGSRPWRVGIQHPRKPGALATLALNDGEAIGTSGDYQRYFELNGQRYCHVIDPRNGYPVQGVQAVTILTQGARAGVLSDASSKPLFISGVVGWRAAAQRVGLEQALLVDAQGAVHLTTAMQKRLEFTDRTTVVKVEP